MDRYTVWFERGAWIVVDTRDCGTIARFETEPEAMADRLRREIADGNRRENGAALGRC